MKNSILIYLKAKSVNLQRILMINVRIIYQCSRVQTRCNGWHELQPPDFFCLICNNFASITTLSATLVQYQGL
jgi:hypothetical protein